MKMAPSRALRSAIIRLFSRDARTITASLCSSCNHQARRSINILPDPPQNALDKTALDPITAMNSRGLIAEVSSRDAPRALVKNPTAAYAGFDPTASSLHVGNLMLILSLIHFQLLGHQPIALVGGATGSIGDPSFRSTERTVMQHDTVHTNTAKITAQLQSIFEKSQLYLNRRALDKGWFQLPPDGMKPVKVLNNLDWFKDMKLLEFLGFAGRQARISTMLARDSVKSRLQSQTGLSFTEFTYQLLQAYDFLYLNTNHSCTVQLGGTDQWGNITAGVDMIRKRNLDVPEAERSNIPAFRRKVYGIVVPLVVNSQGEKFGKSAGNAMWLDSEMLSPFDFFQFFKKTADADVEKYLKYFTFVPLPLIQQVMEEHQSSPSKQIPQRILASEVTELVHGEEESRKAIIMTDVLYDSTEKYKPAEIISAFQSSPHFTSLPYDQVVGKSIIDVAVATGALPTKKGTRRCIAENALSLGFRKITTPEHIVSVDDTMEGKLILLRVGKPKYRVVELVS
ncbi:tyrosine---tRNA ligase [Synchytrium microbalum]|uniref:Tyrosine--tRNA ligase n=1 Tax=Synchytrium microbalum TaxID=1806994 RepID=A0A507C3A0_9FUNG|nr:tyrosine---tRNA ligase [Synchytrium microbalum]TPX35990.1 tyrosine---tRNA ligase [Synchytrium microbalum]